MKLLILFVLAVLFSAICSYIFTNPNKYSKACEAPADQPLIGIIGVCLYLIGMTVIVTAFADGAIVGYVTIGVWFGVYLAVRYALKSEQREYKRLKEIEKKKQQEAQEIRNWLW